MNAVVAINETVELDEDAIEAAQAKKDEVLTKLGESLEADKDKAVRWRLPIEQRWIDDLRQKYGEQPNLPEVKSQNAVPAGSLNTSDAEFRRTRDNITRPAAIQIAARKADMLFPTNEKNWDLTPSPLPELTNPDEVMLDEMGQPYMIDGPADPETGEPTKVEMKAADIATRAQKIADQKCTRMKQYIDDALQECKYPRHGRRAIQDSSDLGTGVLKGPIIRRTRQTSFTNFTMPDGSKIPSITVKPKESPAIEWVDTWNFFPQPCRDISEADHAYELHLLTKKKVRELADQPGFDKEQVNKLLGMDPDLGCLAEGGSLVARDRILSPDLETMKDRYAVWEYHGPIQRDALEVLGIETDPDDHLTTYTGEVWFSQGTVLKVTLTADEYADCLPYYLDCFEKDPNCCFGFSVAYVMRSDQYAVNQTWHAVMLNALMSAGTQVGVVPGMMEAPSGGKLDLTCLKPRVWAMKSEVQDIKQVLSFFQPPNNTGPLMQVYETARRNASEKTLLPQYMEGKASEVTKTSSGLAMLMNSGNIVQREGAKSWDDNVTIPMIGALARYFLLSDDVDDEAKGDYQVVPKGESYLLVKDVQAQHVQVLTGIAENPKYAPYFDTWELLQLNIKTLSLPVGNLLRERQTVEAEMKAAAGQPDPETLKAQAATAQAEASTARAQAEAQKAAEEAKFRIMDRQLDHEEHKAEMADRNAERIARLTMMEAQLGMEGNKLLSKESTDLERTAAKERTDMQRIEVEQVKTGMQARMKAEELASKEQKIATEVAVEGPVRLA